MTIASFKTISPEDRIANGDAAAERMATSVVTAFQHRSLKEYTALFPSVESFHRTMEMYSSFYGANLEAAKKEFKMQYTKEVLPALNQSFNTIIAQGTKEGIDWSTIKLVSVEFNEESPASSATITFSSNGKKYRLDFAKTLHMKGEWKVTQYVKLS